MLVFATSLGSYRDTANQTPPHIFMRVAISPKNSGLCMTDPARLGLVFHLVPGSIKRSTSARFDKHRPFVP
jgi:hypothetical protein